MHHDSLTLGDSRPGALIDDGDAAIVGSPSECGRFAVVPSRPASELCLEVGEGDDLGDLGEFDDLQPVNGEDLPSVSTSGEAAVVLNH
jgi:hypothetical protein